MRVEQIVIVTHRLRKLYRRARAQKSVALQAGPDCDSTVLLTRVCRYYGQHDRRSLRLVAQALQRRTRESIPCHKPARSAATVWEAMAGIDIGLATGVLATFLGSDPIAFGGAADQKEHWLSRIAEEGLLRNEHLGVQANCNTQSR